MSLYLQRHWYGRFKGYDLDNTARTGSRIRACGCRLWVLDIVINLEKGHSTSDKSRHNYQNIVYKYIRVKVNRLPTDILDYIRQRSATVCNLPSSCNWSRIIIQGFTLIWIK